jgi:hypothetical protein
MTLLSDALSQKVCGQTFVLERAARPRKSVANLSFFNVDCRTASVAPDEKGVSQKGEMN